jgi:hypothetical protein
MMFRTLLLVIAALVGPAAFAHEPESIYRPDLQAKGKPAIRLPDVGPPPKKPAPAPAPADPSAPRSTATIPADAIYAIDSDEELHVLCSPPALIKVTCDPGPGWVRAVFVGGTGKLEKKQLAATAGSGELIIWPKSGAATDADIIRQPIATLIVPRPPKDDVTPAPKPAPPPAPPQPEPGPGPVASPNVAWIIVVEESAKRTPAEGKLFTDAAFWNSMRAKGVQMKLYDRDAIPPAKHYLDYEDQAIDLTTGQPSPGVPFVLLLDKGGKVIEAFKYPAMNQAIAKRIGK